MRGITATAGTTQGHRSVSTHHTTRTAAHRIARHRRTLRRLLLQHEHLHGEAGVVLQVRHGRRALRADGGEHRRQVAVHHVERHHDALARLQHGLEQHGEVLDLTPLLRNRPRLPRKQHGSQHAVAPVGASTAAAAAETYLLGREQARGGAHDHVDDGQLVGLQRRPRGSVVHDEVGVVRRQRLRRAVRAEELGLRHEGESDGERGRGVRTTGSPGGAAGAGGATDHSRRGPGT